MEVDYPAAHSMDSSWFAVDKDGHVAYFDTGADGAVPNDAAPGPGAYTDVYDEMDELPPEVQESLGDRPPDILGTLERLVPAQRPKADRGSRKTGPPDAARRGLYVYTSRIQGVAGVYERDWLPAKPLHVDELPPEIRRALKGLQFRFRFADTPAIQPFEHAICSAWGPAWMSTDGKTIQAVPGFEADYAKMHQELVNDFPDAVVQPPVKAKKKQSKKPKRKK